MIYLAIDVNTSMILAIFKNSSDCLSYTESVEASLMVPFNSKHHEAEARALFVGDVFKA